MALILLCLIGAALALAAVNAAYQRKQQDAVNALATQLRIEFPDHAGVITDEYAQQVTNTLNSYHLQTQPVHRKLSRLAGKNKEENKRAIGILQQTLQRMQLDYNNRFIANAPGELQYYLAELATNDIFDRHMQALERARLILR